MLYVKQPDPLERMPGMFSSAFMQGMQDKQVMKALKIRLAMEFDEAPEGMDDKAKESAGYRKIENIGWYRPRVTPEEKREREQAKLYQQWGEGESKELLGAWEDIEKGRYSGLGEGRSFGPDFEAVRPPGPTPAQRVAQSRPGLAAMGFTPEMVETIAPRRYGPAYQGPRGALLQEDPAGKLGQIVAPITERAFAQTRAGKKFDRETQLQVELIKAGAKEKKDSIAYNQSRLAFAQKQYDIDFPLGTQHTAAEKEQIMQQYRDYYDAQVKGLKPAGPSVTDDDYEIGQIAIDAQGRKRRFMGGDPADEKNWEIVKKSKKVEPKARLPKKVKPKRTLSWQERLRLEKLRLKLQLENIRRGGAAQTRRGLSSFVSPTLAREIEELKRRELR